MNQKKIYEIICKFLSEEYNCNSDLFNKSGLFFTEASEKMLSFQNPALQIMTMGNSTIISASKDLLSVVKNLTDTKTREEIFELPYVYGHSIYFIPNKNFKESSLTQNNFSTKLFERDSIQKLANYNEFPNAIIFDKNNQTESCIALCAIDGSDNIIAIAAAGPLNDQIWEIGIDVLANHRNQGIATHLVTKLTTVILSKGIVPVYCAASSNIFSQALASACNYRPCWMSTYKNILDGTSVYDNLLKTLYSPK